MTLFSWFLSRFEPLNGWNFSWVFTTGQRCSEGGLMSPTCQKQANKRCRVFLNTLVWLRSRPCWRLLKTRKCQQKHDWTDPTPTWFNNMPQDRRQSIKVRSHSLVKTSYIRSFFCWTPASTICFGTDSVIYHQSLHILTSWLASFTFLVISFKWTFPTHPSVWFVYDSSEQIEKNQTKMLLFNILEAVHSLRLRLR